MGLPTSAYHITHLPDVAKELQRKVMLYIFVQFKALEVQVCLGERHALHRFGISVFLPIACAEDTVENMAGS